MAPGWTLGLFSFSRFTRVSSPGSYSHSGGSDSAQVACTRRQTLYMSKPHGASGSSECQLGAPMGGGDERERTNRRAGGEWHELANKEVQRFFKVCIILKNLILIKCLKFNINRSTQTIHLNSSYNIWIYFLFECQNSFIWWELLTCNIWPFTIKLKILNKRFSLCFFQH